MMKIKWNIDDLIDLEYFLHQDEKSFSDHEKRDRKIFLQHIEPFFKKNRGDRTGNRKFIIGKWLDARRQVELSNKGNEAFLPGDAFNHAYALLLFLFIMTGFLTGSGSAFSYLVYKGTETLNVSSYLGIFVLSQVLLLLMIGVYIFVYRNTKTLKNFSIVRFIVSSLLVKTTFLIKKSSLNRLSVEKRNNIESVLGIIKGKSNMYGTLFPWPVFILSQIFGVFFNIGVLTATLLRVLGSDLAFGWQSTLQLSSEAIYKAVACISMPWNRLVPSGIAHPSLEQIEGTRMVLKDGITSLATTDLVSWWPFLCFAVLFYGLLPRFALLIVGITGKHITLNRINLQSVAFDKLILRLQTPFLDTEGEPQINGRPVFSPNSIPENPVTLTTNAFQTINKTSNLMTMIPEDIMDICNHVELEHHIRQLFGAVPKKSIPVTFDFPTDKERLSSLMFGINTLVILQEAWQPPIRETIMYFQDLRHFAGPAIRIHILLTGKPSRDTLFTKTETADLSVWQHKINSLGDPNITLEQISMDEQHDE